MASSLALSLQCQSTPLSVVEGRMDGQHLVRVRVRARARGRMRVSLPLSMVDGRRVGWTAPPLEAHLLRLRVRVRVRVSGWTAPPLEMHRRPPRSRQPWPPG
eukprot:scaffold65893_cov26-Phaeocystis_antarctica.AAC.1